MNEMVKDDQFKSMLEKWVAENQKPKPSMKNVVMNSTINAGGDVKIGDEKVSNQVVNKKNVVKSSNITAGGDFILGDR